MLKKQESWTSDAQGWFWELDFINVWLLLLMPQLLQHQRSRLVKTILSMLVFSHCWFHKIIFKYWSIVKQSLERWWNYIFLASSEWRQTKKDVLHYNQAILYCSLYLFEKVLMYIVVTSFGSANIMDMKSKTPNITRVVRRVCLRIRMTDVKLSTRIFFHQFLSCVFVLFVYM